MNAYMIKLNAGHDVNGNPRRAYVLYEGCCIQGAWRENYNSYMAVPEEYREMAKMAPTIITTNKFLRECLAVGRA